MLLGWQDGPKIKILKAQKRVNPTGLTRRGSPCFGTEVPKHVPIDSGGGGPVES